MGKTSEAQKRAVKKYEEKNVESFRFKFPKGKKEIIRKCADKNGESVNAMLYRLVKDEVKRVLPKSDSKDF